MELFFPWKRAAYNYYICTPWVNRISSCLFILLVYITTTTKTVHLLVCKQSNAFDEKLRYNIINHFNGGGGTFKSHFRFRKFILNIFSVKIESTHSDQDHQQQTMKKLILVWQSFWCLVLGNSRKKIQFFSNFAKEASYI